LNLTKDWITYTVAGIAGATNLKSNTLVELELWSKTY
jgi:hypothetical protein